MDVAGEDRRLEAVAGRVRLLDRIIEVCSARERDDGAEDLLALHLVVARRACDHGRSQEPVVAQVAARQHLALRLADPREHAVALVLGDQRPDVRRRVRRIADLERADLCHEARYEVVPGAVHDVDALDRDAALAGEREGIRGEARDCPRRGIAADDRRRRVAELEFHPLAVRPLGDSPADTGGAGERDQLDPVVLDQHVADRGRRARDDVQPARRQTRFLLEVGQEHGRQRRCSRGLEDDGAAGCECGRDLVGDEVEGEVERRDRADDPDRQAQRQGELALAGGRRVHRDDLAREPPCLDGGEDVGRDRALGLDAGRLQRLARLGRDRLRRFFLPFLQEVRDPVEDPGSLVSREGCRHCLLGGSQRTPRLVGAALRDPADDFPGVGGANLGPVARLDPLAADQE